MAIHNIDQETGIRYGVGNMNNVQSWLYDELEPVYPECECEYEDNCMCDSTGSSIIDTDTLKAELNEYGELWIFYSEYVAPCRECSPCAPNAGDLTSPDEHGYLAYCLPPEYYHDEDEFRHYVTKRPDLQMKGGVA